MPRRAGKTKAADFFNSPLGLWILSTIFIGGLTFGYGIANTLWSAHERRADNIRKLAVEIRSRTAQFEGIYLGADNAKREAQFRIALLNLLRPPSASAGDGIPIYAAFPEYRDRPLVSLTIELLTVTSKTEHAAIAKAFEWSILTTPTRVSRESIDKVGRRV